MKLELLPLLALVAVVAEAASSCSNGITIRKDYRDMSKVEWDSYMDAIKTLRSTKSSKGNFSKYEEWIQLHAQYSMEAHSDANFGWWHRIYLQKYEQALMGANPNMKGGLPYWDWSANYANPGKASLFTDAYLGGSKSNGVNDAPCVADGPFAGFKFSYFTGDDQCLRRGFSPASGASSAWSQGDSTPRFQSPAELSAMLTNENDFQSFHDLLQYNSHATPHVFIGGKAGQMAAIPKAAGDPAFTMHHAYIDYLLSMYQKRHDISGQVSDASYKAWNGAKASDAWDLEGTMCIKYQPYSGWTPKPKPTTSTTKKTTTTTSSTTTSSSSSSSSSSASSASTSSSGSTTSTSSSSASTSSSASSASTSVVPTTTVYTITTPIYKTTLSTTVSGTSTYLIPITTATSYTVIQSTAVYTPTVTQSSSTTSSAAPTSTNAYVPTNPDQSQYNKDTYYDNENCPYLPPANKYLPPPPASFVESAMYPPEKVKACHEKVQAIASSVSSAAAAGTYLPPAIDSSYLQTTSGNGSGGAAGSSAVARASGAVAAVLVAVVGALVM
ncbi:hypothetical protein BC828DRAFT_388872 [Blastocladiella britannica]|nr:hypothetical protein BC828DRAFT_388872 [Blastocladiella britannica]